MELCRVPKVETPVRILLDDGRTLDGGIFTSASGPHGGPETVMDRLADPAEEFLPVACGNDRMLINRRGIVFVRCSREAVGADADEEGARLEPVRMSLTLGMSLVGRLVIRMPPERARVLDYLNSAPRFVPLLGEGEITLVQKHFIVSVRSGAEGK
jgi:hypothetical protein